MRNIRTLTISLLMLSTAPAGCGGEKNSTASATDASETTVDDCQTGGDLCDNFLTFGEDTDDCGESTAGCFDPSNASISTSSSSSSDSCADSSAGCSDPTTATDSCGATGCESSSSSSTGSSSSTTDNCPDTGTAGGTIGGTGGGC